MNNEVLGQEELNELVQLCAVDSNLFAHTFFDKTMRQTSPKFHQHLWDIAEGNNRFTNFQLFRGAGKTSICRIYTAKRIAYGLAHTILYIGKSEGHALKSIKWIRNQVERNHKYKEVFKLRPGKKWQDSEAEVWHETDNYPIWILGLGITGSIRGVNLDDFRPDLIIVDDVMDEENSATAEQRTKIEDLILSALKHSLSPASESPDAKMIMLQTPLNKEDASCKSLLDPEWVSAVFGCWTPETANLPTELQESYWPERYPSVDLRRQKAAAIQRNKLSLWMREMECRLISPETSAFRESWLQFYDVLPERMSIVIVVDPVPPPTALQIQKGLRGKDFEAFSVVGRWKENFFLLEYSLNRGHEPDWSIGEFMRLAMKWKPRYICVETTAYQKTLAWLFKKAMEHHHRYFVIKELDDRRSKYDKIVDGLNGAAANGHLFIKKDHTEFAAQFNAYPNISHDDLIETVAIGVSELSNIQFEDFEDSYSDDERHIPKLQYVGGAP